LSFYTQSTGSPSILPLPPHVAPQGDTGGTNPSRHQKLPRRQLPSLPLLPALAMVAAGPAAKIVLGMEGVGDGRRGCWGGVRRRAKTRAAPLCPGGGGGLSWWCAGMSGGGGWAGVGPEPGQTLDHFLGISTPPPHVSVVPWSAAAGDGPALLCRCPPHYWPSWCGIGCGRCCMVPGAGTISWRRTALWQPPTFLF
jgi:hypothetical protein